MEPITIGLGLGALWLLSRMKGKSATEGVTSDNFGAWGPDQQGEAWYAAVSTPWVAAGPYQAVGGGQSAQTYRYLNGGIPDAVRAPNDANFRSLMSQGYRIAVNGDVLGGPNPLLVVYPDGFPRSGLPASWGVLRQLFAPPPGSFGTPPNGGGLGGSVQPLGGGSDPFAALPEPSRSSARELYQSDSASLLDLEDMAKALDKAGFPEAAAALRQRRDELKLSRQLDAQGRGGWLYTLRNSEALPFKLAQYYGGVRPGALKELAAVNPSVSANNWKGWIGGTDILLPKAWPDPALKPLPPLTQGQLPQGGGGGGGGPANSGTGPTIGTPYGPYTPGQPLPSGTTAAQVPGLGQEAFPVPPGSTAPGGFIWGPPWVGNWTPPKSGDLDPYKSGVLDWVDGGPGSVTPQTWGQAPR